MPVFTRQRILDLALALPGASSDMPFEGDFDSTVLRHRDSGKWFGLLMKAPRDRIGLDGEGMADILNLKCDPLLSYGLRQIHPDLVPAWHMNKQHWITVRLEGDLPEEVLASLIQMSYDLTGPRRKKDSGA